MRPPAGWLRLFTVLLVALGSGTVQSQVTLNVATGTAGIDYWLLQSAVNRFMIHNPDVEVRVLLTPELTDDRLTLLRNFFEVQSPELDVLQLDVIWVPELAQHLQDLSSLQAVTGAIHPSLLAQMTVADRLVAMPWFTSFGLLYYRSDLLQQYGFPGPPLTWAELAETARLVQAGERAAGNADFWGFVWQGDAYEGLTVNALEWIASSGGGRLIEADGTVSIANDNAELALLRARDWIGDISPPEVLTFTEDDSFEQFVHGNALFLRSWPSYHAQLRDSPRLQGRYAVTLLPAAEPGATRTGVYGGQSLAISAYSRESAAALRLVRFLSSEAEQRAAAWDGSRIPTRSQLWFDREVISAIPFLPELLPLHGSAVRRPVWQPAGLWSSVSAQTYAAVQAVLRGDEDAETALLRLAAAVQYLTGLPAAEPEPPR